MKYLLLITLFIAFLIEAALTFLLFFKIDIALKMFGIVNNDQISFLAYIIAWFCLLATISICYMIYGVQKNVANVDILIYIFGIWWIGLGIAVYIIFKKTDNLILDSLKGFLLIVFNFYYRRTKLKVKLT